MIATNVAEAAVSMAEAQAYARVETGEEEALLAGLVRTASALCESFTGQVLVARPFEEMLPAGPQWQRLALTPIRAIEEVALVAPDGSSTVLPAFEFEIDVDSRGDGWVRVAEGGDKKADASGGTIEASIAMSVAGFAAHGSSVRAGLAQLIELAGVTLVDRDGRLRSPAADVPLMIEPDDVGCEADGPGGPKAELSRAPDGEMPALLAITYYDPARDYQAGQVQASSGKGGSREARLELPAVLEAGEARQLAESALARRWLSGERLKLRLPPSQMALRPGDAIQQAGKSRAWIVRRTFIEGMAVSVEAEAAPIAIRPLPADPGKPVLEPDIAVGRSHLALFELPAEGDAPSPAPLAFVAASNLGLWRNLPIELMLGDQPLPGIAISRRSIVGRTETALDGRCPFILDERSQVVVRLANDAHVLLNMDRDALMAGANLALIGDELVQFGRAEQLEAGLFRLSHLLRGRRGTEWAASRHAIGERFCVIDPSRLRSLQLAAGTTGALLKAVARGVGDAEPSPETSLSLDGEAMRPPAPCHIGVVRAGAEITVRWVRRSYRHWAWADGLGDSADPFPELYRLGVAGPGGETVIETASPTLVIGPTQFPAQPGEPIVLTVETIGPAGLSRPATKSLTL